MTHRSVSEQGSSWHRLVAGTTAGPSPASARAGRSSHPGSQSPVSPAPRDGGPDRRPAQPPHSPGSFSGRLEPGLGCRLGQAALIGLSLAKLPPWLAQLPARPALSQSPAARPDHIQSLRISAANTSITGRQPPDRRNLSPINSHRYATQNLTS